jgi:hypothetical protein
MDNLEGHLLQEFVAALLHATKAEVLDKQLEVPFDSEEGRRRLDARFGVRMPTGEDLVVAVEVLRDVYPRDVRMTVHQLWAYENALESNRDTLLFIVADHLSPGAKKALRDAGINYYDSSGTMYFQHRTWLIDVERSPKERPTRRPSSVFTGAREQVVHALLHHWWTSKGKDFISGAELAAEAATSTYTVSLTMQELERHDWVESSGKGPTQRRRLRDAAGLLDAWGLAWQQRREVVTRWYAYAPGAGGIVDFLLWRLAKRQDWALTGAAAANAVLPYLTHVDRAEVIVPPGTGEQWAKDLKLSQAEKGPNVIFIERKGASLMFLDEHPERPDSRFASRFIQYLDLLNNYGRNKELAEEYRQEVLKIEPRK